MSESFSLKELYKNVEACKNTYEFKKIFVIDECIAQSKQLAENLPKNLRAKDELQKAVVKTYDRLVMQKKHFITLSKNDYKDESELMTSLSGIRFIADREQEAWSTYTLIDTQQKNGATNGFSVNFSSIFTVIAFFLFIYLFNVVISGNWRKAKYIIQLRYFKQDYLAELVEKDFTQYKTALISRSKEDKKEDKKNNVINGLTLDERRFLNKIYKNIRLIDRAYALDKAKNRFIGDDKDKIQDQIEIILSDFYKKIDYVPLD